jgi:hypothetical protein
MGIDRAAAALLAEGQFMQCGQSGWERERDRKKMSMSTKTSTSTSEQACGEMLT